MATKKSRDELDQESADRHNARNADRWALWKAAGKIEDVAPSISAEDVQFNREDRADYWASASERTRRRALAYRKAVAELVSESELAALDERRLRFPKGHEYSAEMFCTELVRLTGRTPLEIFNEFKNRPDYYSDMVQPAAPDDLAAQIKVTLLGTRTNHQATENMAEANRQ